MRRAFTSGCPLHEAGIRRTVHADAAAAARKGRRPFHGVVAVHVFVEQREPLAIGTKPSARVLHDDHIATSRHLRRIEDPAAQREILAVGGAREQHRPWARAGWAVYIGTQRHAVAHRRGHIELDLDGALRLRGGHLWTLLANIWRPRLLCSAAPGGVVAADGSLGAASRQTCVGAAHGAKSRSFSDGGMGPIGLRPSGETRRDRPRSRHYAIAELERENAPYRVIDLRL